MWRASYHRRRAWLEWLLLPAHLHRGLRALLRSVLLWHVERVDILIACSKKCVACHAAAGRGRAGGTRRARRRGDLAAGGQAARRAAASRGLCWTARKVKTSRRVWFVTL